MSIPKEPRQKMINMMYLVLTALLALNVSAEILNAFKTVNNSLVQSNAVVSDKNQIIYNAFAKEETEAQTMERAKFWGPKAEEVKKLSDGIYGMLEKYKDQLIDESSPSVGKDGQKEFNESSLDAATRLFDTKGQGKILYDALKTYKESLINVLKPEEFAGQDLIQKDVAAQKAIFTKQLPLDITVPISQSGNARTADSAHDWTLNYFHMTPTIAAMTILSKFENDIKNSEAQMIDYLHKKVGEVKVVYDQFQVLAQASSNYVMPGDELHVYAGVGAFSSSVKPAISINGQPMPLTAAGTADFSTKAEGAGEHTVMVHVHYTKPDGSPFDKDQPVKYTVGTPSGASVFLQKMNVLYVGEDNPLSISAGSTGAEKMHVSFTGQGAITHNTGDNWSVKPTAPGMAKIVVTTNGKPFEFEMRVKYLPDPIGYIGAHKNGAISSAEFKAIGGVIAKLEGSEFQAPFLVTSFKVSAIGGPIPSYSTAANEGNRWTGRAADLVNRCGPGTNVFFDEIHVKGRDGKDRVLPSMVFALK